MSRGELQKLQKTVAIGKRKEVVLDEEYSYLLFGTSAILMLVWWS